MGYYDEEKNVKEYIQMAEGFDGALLIDVLKDHLPIGSRVLELGMGPGKDLDILNKDYIATGSDNSQFFLDLYSSNHENADILKLDAITIDTIRKFDCIYSNKVLHHLSIGELQISFQRQAEILDSRGVVMHSFWYGDQEVEEHHGLRFYYYIETDLIELAGDNFDNIACQRYTEMEDDDLVYLLMRKKT